MNWFFNKSLKRLYKLILVATVLSAVVGCNSQYYESIAAEATYSVLNSFIETEPYITADFVEVDTVEHIVQYSNPEKTYYCLFYGAGGEVTVTFDRYITMFTGYELTGTLTGTWDFDPGMFQDPWGCSYVGTVVFSGLAESDISVMFDIKSVLNDSELGDQPDISGLINFEGREYNDFTDWDLGQLTVESIMVMIRLRNIVDSFDTVMD